MTRLSLHHEGENPNLSIHLREGQYCTVGSSAAADYSLRAGGVGPVHCRIGCQPSGGYIECLDASDSISVNDVRKGRSRLSNGDALRIGTVNFRVELPELAIMRPNFAVEFESEETPTTKIVEGFEHDRQTDSDDQSESQPPVSPEQEDLPDSDVATNSVGGSDTTGDPESRRGADSFPETSDAPQGPADEPEPSEDDVKHPLTVKPEDPVARPSADDSKPLFEFDSAEPADMEISHSEFEELSKPVSNHVTIGAVDLEKNLVDSSPAESDDTASSSSHESAEPDEDETGLVFPGGMFMGKYWKWTGNPAISALQQLIGMHHEAFVYRSDINQIYADHFEDVSLSGLTRLQPAVFLISSLDVREVQKLVRQKRWEDRIGHPQAVTMFLTFMPKRILTDFFDAIEACVLIHENDVELIRIRKSF